MIGKMKDKLNGINHERIYSVKMYSLKYEKNATMTKAKGVKKNEFKYKIQIIHNLNFKNYGTV